MNTIEALERNLKAPKGSLEQCDNCHFRDRRRLTGCTATLWGVAWNGVCNYQLPKA